MTSSPSVSAAFRAGPALETAVGTTTQSREVSAGVAGLALLSAVGAGAAALAWSPRSV
jgi:hypothetical protein